MAFFVHWIKNVGPDLSGQMEVVSECCCPMVNWARRECSWYVVLAGDRLGIRAKSRRRGTPPPPPPTPPLQSCMYICVERIPNTTCRILSPDTQNRSRYSGGPMTVNSAVKQTRHSPGDNMGLRRREKDVAPSQYVATALARRLQIIGVSPERGG